MLINEKEIEPWKSLVKEAEKLIECCFVFDGCYYQFPNYYLKLDLEKEDSEQNMLISICLNISLLTNSYTVYFESTMNPSGAPSGNPMLTMTLYGAETAKGNEPNQMLALKDLVELHFKNYSFIPHEGLFKRKILGGLPHGEDIGIIKEYYLMVPYILKKAD